MSVKVCIGTLTGDDYILVQPDVNVKSTFGMHAFLANTTTHASVTLDEHGCPSPPLSAEDTYSLLSTLPGPLAGSVQKNKGSNKKGTKCEGGEGSEGDASPGGEGGEEGLLVKLQECMTWLAAAKKANAGLRAQLRRCEETARAAGCGAGKGGKEGAGGEGEYGFGGKVVRPKDVAKAEVLGEAHELVKAAPALASQVDGGGAEWQSQPIVGFKPIGYFEGCFKEKNGTPRQGLVSRSSRGFLKILFSTTPEQTTLGLDQYTHVWVLWLFHDNGNRAVRPLVHPPRLDGEKQGVFATRTPHRPNAIGMSLCRLERIEGGVIHLSSVDIIHGTPVLDIKPYIPDWDSHGSDECSIPSWIRQSEKVPSLDVSFSELSLIQLEALKGTFKYFQGADDAKQTIEDVLKWDPRSVHLRKSADFSPASNKFYVFAVDSIDVMATFEGAHVNVVEIVPVYSKLQRSIERPEADATA